MAVIDRVDARAAAEHIDARLTPEHVVAIAAIEDVVARAADQQVIALAAIEHIGAIIGLGLVLQISDRDGVVDVAARQRVPPADQHVISIQAEDCLAPRAAVDRVVAIVADNDGAQRPARTGGGIVIVARIGGRSADINDVLDIGDLLDLQARGQHIDRVVPAPGFLAHDIVGRIDEIDVVATIARHAVGAAAAIEDVVSVIADQDVVVAAADAVLDVILGLVGIMPGKDRNVVAVTVDAGELPRTQVKDRSRRRAGKVDGVGAAGVMDDKADIVLHAGGGQLIAVLRAVEPIDVVAGVQVDRLIGAHAVCIDGGEETADHRLDIRHHRRRGRPARGFAHVDPVEIGHDAVLLAVIDPGRVIEIVDLDAARAAVIVKTGMVQAEFMAEFMNEAVENVTADIGLVGLRVMEALADADIAVAGEGAAVARLAQFRADHPHPLRRGVPRLVIDDHELERRDRGPHLQRADGGCLVFGVIVEFGDVDHQRTCGDRRGQAAIQRAQIFQIGLVIRALVIWIVRRLIVDPPLFAGINCFWYVYFRHVPSPL